MFHRRETIPKERKHKWQLIFACNLGGFQAPVGSATQDGNLSLTGYQRIFGHESVSLLDEGWKVRILVMIQGVRL